MALALLPWLAARLHRDGIVACAGIAQGSPRNPAPQDAIGLSVAALPAGFSPRAVAAALPGLVLITTRIVKLQSPRAAPLETCLTRTPEPRRAPARPAAQGGIGAGGLWTTILATSAIALGTPLFLRWQDCGALGADPNPRFEAVMEAMVLFVTGVAFVLPPTLFIFGVVLLRRVLRDRDAG